MDPLRTGNQLARDGLFHEAVKSYRKVLAKKPNDAHANRNIGIMFVKLSDYSKAIFHLEKAISEYQNNFDANYYLAEAYRAQNKYAQAIFRYQKALDVRPEDPKSLKALAWSYFRIRFYSEALRTSHRLVKQNPKDPQANIILARTLIKLKKFNQALANTKKAMSFAAKRWVPYIKSVQGDIFFELNQVDKAARFYRSALKAQPLLAGALLGMGRCLAMQGHHEQAIPYISKAIKVRPQMAEAHLSLAQVYENIDSKKAIQHYRQFGRQAARDPEFLNLLEDVEKRIGILHQNHTKNKKRLN